VRNENSSQLPLVKRQFSEIIQNFPTKMDTTMWLVASTVDTVGKQRVPTKNKKKPLWEKSLVFKLCL
jgi:hypothetical protein